MFIKDCFFSLRFWDFSELCQFGCSGGVLPAWYVYTHWHREKGRNILKSSEKTQYLMNYENIISMPRLYRPLNSCPINSNESHSTLRSLAQISCSSTCRRWVAVNGEQFLINTLYIIITATSKKELVLSGAHHKVEETSTLQTVVVKLPHFVGNNFFA